MEKEYTPTQLSMAESHLAQALAETRAALLHLGDPVPDGNKVPYNPDNEVSCSYWYLHLTQQEIREQQNFLTPTNQLSLWDSLIESNNLLRM